MGLSWLDLDLRYFVTFRVLAEELSFRATASRLGFAQSAISQHISKLERHVGARLVDRRRGTRSVVLTSDGERLLAHVSGILSRVAIAERDFNQQTSGGGGVVRIGVLQSVSAALVAPVIAELTRIPRIDVELIDSGSPLELLRAGEIDLAFSDSLPETNGVQYQQLLTDPYFLVAPAKHPPFKELSFELLATLPLLTYPSSGHLTEVEHEIARSGVRLRTVLTSNDAPTLRALVASGVGFALLPGLALVDPDSRLRAYPVPAIRPRAICICWNEERQLSQAMQRVIEALAARARELGL